MSDTSRDPEAEAAAGGEPAAPPIPPLFLNTQYVRDLTFRVPGAPGIYAQQQNFRPHVNLQLDVQVRPAQEGAPVFEVTLSIQCNATMQQPAPDGEPPATAFVVDLAYCGIFTLQNVAQNAVEPVLLAECPRLLFPFARNVIADVTREAGFPPVLLQPVDFVAMWQARRAAQVGAAQAAAASLPGAAA